jgi:seryl-tRNA synthetase
MCTGDLGYAAAAKKYDVEVWLPSSSEWMETMSDSITTDFQARRLNMKLKQENGDKVNVYTLNDTGATDRLLIAVLDHYQQADGSVSIPKALQPYTGKTELRK